MKTNKTRKYIAIIGVFLLCLISIVPQRTNASVWGEDIEAVMIQEAMEEAKYAFISSMVASLKIKANKLISDKVRSLLTGDANRGPLFIANYEDFIFNSANKETQVYVTDLFDSVTQTASDDTRQPIKTAEVAIQNELQGKAEQEGTNLDDYVSGGLDNLFDEVNGGGNAAMLALVSNPYNNQYGAYVQASKSTEGKLEQLTRAKEAEALAGQGFVSKVDPQTNMINLPGSVLKELVSTAESLPMMMIAYANTIPEVVGSMAAQIISQAIDAGIAKVTRPHDNKLSNINASSRGGVNDIQTDIYNGIKFIK